MLHVAAVIVIALLWEIADTLSHIKGECKCGVSKEKFSSDITEEWVYSLRKYRDGTVETTAYKRVAGGSTLADYIRDSTSDSGYTSTGHTNGSITRRGYDSKA